jgi:PAS domain S-box-containing protein
MQGRALFCLSCVFSKRRPGPFARTVVTGVLLCLLASLGGVGQSAKKNALVMMTFFDRDHSSLDGMESSLRAHVPWPVSFTVSYLENPRFEEDSYRESLAETFRLEFKREKPDIVIASSEPALLFAVKYREVMFPGVPIVFWAISTALADQKMPGVTGVATPSGTRGTIDLALRLNPDTAAIAVITNNSQTEQVWLADVHNEMRPHLNKVREIDIVGPASQQMLDRIAALPPHTIALFQLFPQDASQPPIGTWDVLSATTLRLPTYSSFDKLGLGLGGIGGAYYNHSRDSQLAGELAARVLAGEKPDNIPVVHNSGLQNRVDWRQLQRWHIPESALPPGTVVLFREPTFWERYRKYLLGTAVVLIAQAFLIGGLLWQRARKRKAEIVLRESEERFRALAESTPALVWMCDTQGRITYLNERRVAFSGQDPNAGYGDAWQAYVHPDDLPGVWKTIDKALKTRKALSHEYRLRRSDGVYRWMFDVASPRVGSDGSFAGFIGSAIDITDQKLAHQALDNLSGKLIAAQEQERARIARELHDDICQRLALLSIEIDLANRGSGQSPGSLKEIQKQCSEIANDVQTLSHKLHSSKLEYLGVVVALRRFCEELSAKNSVSAAFSTANVPANLPQTVSLCLFRVAQEALHNALKYSGTREFTVELTGSADGVRLEIADRGAGFDVENARQSRGLGLVSMQERVHLVNGAFSIESSPGGGTRVIASVPLVNEAHTDSESAAVERTL